MSTLLAPIEIQRPPVIHFGPGMVAQVGSYARAQGFSRVLVVSDAFNAGRVELLELPSAPVVFARRPAEPDIPNLQTLLALAEATRPDLVVGFGGGSAMDLAKLAAVLPAAARPSTTWSGPRRSTAGKRGWSRCHNLGHRQRGGHPRAGDRPRDAKQARRQSRHMLADLAVVDPDLTLTVPPRSRRRRRGCAGPLRRGLHQPQGASADRSVRAGGGQPCRPLPARAVRTAATGRRGPGWRWLPSMAGSAWDRSTPRPGHALAYPLGTRHHIPHGASYALIFPHVLAFNAPAVAGKDREDPCRPKSASGRRRGCHSCSAYGFCTALGLEMRLSRNGVREIPISKAWRPKR